MKKCYAMLLVVAALATAGCGGGPPPGSMHGGPEIVEGGVLFRYFDREAEHVNVAGDFNNWSAQADPMVDENGDGEWTLFYSLQPGTYEYKFVVDGVTWIHDPRNAETVADGFDGLNSVIRVPNP